MFLLCLIVPARAQVTQLQKATAAQITAGVNDTRYITPKGLADAGGGGGGDTINNTYNVAATNIIDATDLVLGGTYVNTTASNLTVRVTMLLTPSVSGAAIGYIKVDNATDGTYETAATAQAGLGTQNAGQVLTANVAPGGTFQITNNASVGGSSVAVVAGTSQRVYSGIGAVTGSGGSGEVTTAQLNTTSNALRSASVPNLAGTWNGSGGTNVTRGGTNFTITFASTNYPYSPLTVAGSTLYPFLNSTNWVYNATNGAYTMNATNFLYLETAYDFGWTFANTLNSPNGTTGIFDYDEFNNTLNISPVGLSFIDSVTFGADGITVSYGGAPQLIQTNYFSNARGQVTHDFKSLESEIVPLETWRTVDGWDLLRFDLEGIAPTKNGKFTIIGNSFGRPYIAGGQGYAALRINGEIAGLEGDPRAQAWVGFYFGNRGEYGASYEFLTRRPTNFTTINQSGVFLRGMVLDSRGGATFGDSPYINHGTDTPGNGWLDIWPSSIRDRPALVLRPGNLSTNAPVNGGVEYDGTNYFGAAARSGATNKYAFLQAGLPGNGVALTNTPFVNLRFDNIVTTPFTSNIAGRIAFLGTNGVTYYLVLSTNVP